ncbi:DNA-directed RNA polymerase V subunit 1-like, partial [Phragmites australis]|uniref:DNA-directed RNA polymerase V subunit 1-like n=1 Tax=Phragmites australis TaxID=29695 RepID=UPI002D7891B9
CSLLQPSSSSSSSVSEFLLVLRRIFVFSSDKFRLSDDSSQGHFGFIELPVPIYHPSHITELGKILNKICLSCLRLKNGKLKRKGAGKESKFTSCSYCQDLPPLCVAEVKKSNGARSLELRASLQEEVGDGFWSFLDQFGFCTRRNTHSRPLLPKEVQNIMQKISQETRRKLAAMGYNLQDGFVMNYMCVPPNCLHISNVLDDNIAMCPPDTSKSLLRKVLRKIEQINSSIIGHPNFQTREIGEESLQVAVADYINMRGTAQDSQHVTFTRQPAPKQWQQKMKTLFISKSSSFSCRAVITGDPYIGLDIVGVPDEIARRMSVEEHVTDYNIARLQDMMDKGLCVTYRDVNSNTYALDVGEANKRRTMLRVGETVNRRVLDGDLVFLNRPPSTDMHSVQAVYVHVHDDHTIKINPLICGPLGADFDGDCVHIFFPRSVSARVEATELFTVENQLVSSHNAKLNFQFKNDCLLALKTMSDRRYSRKEASQIAMFSSAIIPPGDHYWTIPQILQTTDALAELPNHPNKESIKALVTAIVSSTLSDKSPREAIKLLNLLQPLLMESLFMDGFSISLSDFNGPSAMLKEIQNSSVELNKFRALVVDFIAHFSALGLLVDPKSDLSLKKLVEQLGFLGRQLQYTGRLYSSNLVEDCYEFLNKCRGSTKCYDPLEAKGVVKSSFYSGLNPYEELLHSIEAREKIIRTSKGLVEPGGLFKNMMAILRDVVVCYDGTIRTSYSNSIVQFDSKNVSSYMTPGDAVGILAATAVANAAYKAVLDPNQNNMASWDSMKEVLLTKANSKTDINDRKVILYLNKYSGVINAVQSCLKRIKVKDCATEVSIKYQQETTQAAHCLVGYIHLDKETLNQMEVTMGSIIQTCQEAIVKQVKKRGKMMQIMTRSNIILSECLCDEDPGDEKALQVSCLQFFLDASIATGLHESTVVHLMINTIFPILLETIIKGDPRVQKTKIIWVELEPELPCWVQNSSAEHKGELALEITVEKAAAAENGGAWGVAMDACIPVMDLIDTARSMPYSIQAVEQVFGISCAFNRVTQHLSKAVGMVTKSVLKEHLNTVASSMTFTGSLHAFNSLGYKATFQSLKVQAPFTEATLYRPMQCFQRSAEKIYSDQLDSVVSTCSWGNHAAIGTGSAFKIHWNNENQSASNEILEGYGLYDFIATVGTIGATEHKAVTPHSSCLYDVDHLPEDEVQEEEVVWLGGNSLIPWTDRPKADSRRRGFKGRRPGMHSTTQEHQGMQTKSNWNSVANWKNDKPSWSEGNARGPPHSGFAGSTSTSGWSKRRFTGLVFERKQRKRSWGSTATQQEDKPSGCRENVADAQNFGIAESSSSGGWNRRISTSGQGGGRAVWKSEGSRRGGSNSRNWKAQKNSSARQGGSYNFTPMEQQIYVQVEPIMKNVKRIIRESRDGIKLSPEDETFIVRNILMYHPEKEKKIAGQGNYIMVAKHQLYHSSRCLYVASSDGICSDFSYKKCLENFIRIRYPGAADSFCRKYFK